MITRIPFTPTRCHIMTTRQTMATTRPRSGNVTMTITRFASAALVLLMLSCCTSLYETGTDASADWSVSAVAAANGGYDDLAPVPLSQGLYFTSNRPVAGEELDRLYLLPHDATLASDVRRVSTGLENGEEIKAGALAVLPGATELYFVECYRGDGVGDCDLVSGRFSADGLSIEDTRPVAPPLNDIEWDHHPAFSGDGRTIIFASERFGGNGGSDLWVSRREGEKWSVPVNLGGTINSSGNEITPYLAPDGETLYFSSDAHPGRGGFDIFVSRRIAGKWSTPEPLGRPFNSGDDAIFFNGTLESNTAYFASNRPGGKGGFDLYRAERKIAPPPPPPPPKEKPLVLRVRAKNAYTMQDIPAQVSISLHADDRLLAEGRGSAETRLDLGAVYSVTGELAGFINAVETVRFAGADEATKASRDEGERMVIEHVLQLVPVTEDERKIYAFTVEFDFNLFNIRPEEERKLDSVVILLAQFPQSTVVFSGHTDSVGTVTYNIKLGYNRAKEVSEYVGDWLEEKGVKLLNPVEIRTYGEAEPVAPNSTEEGRQRNRRVEIAIVRNR